MNHLMYVISCNKVEDHYKLLGISQALKIVQRNNTLQKLGKLRFIQIFKRYLNCSKDLKVIQIKH